MIYVNVKGDKILLISTAEAEALGNELGRRRASSMNVFDAPAKMLECVSHALFKACELSVSAALRFLIRTLQRLLS
jgi:uncharacterized ferritin-like protein (DUF455 family)